MNQSTPIINHYVALVKINDFDESLGFVEEIANNIIKDLELNVVEKISHLFSPKGVTLAFILSESHLIIHTWPELGYLHIDLVTCSYRSQEEFGKSLKSALVEQKIDHVKIISVKIGQ